MKFRTELNVVPSTKKLGIKSPILTIGSCFAEVIGGRLEDNKCRVLSNPFGVIFNPVSILKILQYCIENQAINKILIAEQKGVFLHYDHHSQFWGQSKTELNEKINVASNKVRTFLEGKPTIIVTLGTSFVYEHLATNEIVANCHKTPAAVFKKKLLSHKEIDETLTNLIQLLRPFSERIILTVSPIRHTKDGIEENQVSKSLLRVACFEMTQKFDFVAYFPSYELMMDDLRDYRFYKSDLIHPNEMAEDYIFRKFVDAYFDDEAIVFFDEWKKIQNALNHKTLHPFTTEHQRFLQNLLENLSSLKDFVNVEVEIRNLEKELMKFDPTPNPLPTEGGGFASSIKKLPSLKGEGLGSNTNKTIS